MRERHTAPRLTLLLLCVALPWLVAQTALAVPPVNASKSSEVAVHGYDVVAYFTDGKPTPGQAQFAQSWNGARWFFASAEHRDTFAADPERYAPRYGGYCAFGVSQGYAVDIDPQAWTIVEGRLYLNYSLSVRGKWQRDIPGHIAQADKNWPGVLSE